MWIFCGGMHRAGSTVQYLLTKEIVEYSGTGKALGYVKKQVFPEIYQKNQSQYKNIVVKSHRVFPDIVKLFECSEAVAVYVYRDLRDTVVSKIKKSEDSFQYSQVLKRIQLNLRSYYQWQQVSPILVSRYEEMVNNLEQEAIRISNFLGLEISSEFAANLANKYSINEQKKRISNIRNNSTNIKETKSGSIVDQETLLHDNHIHSGASEQWKSELTPIQVAFIEDQACEWLIAHDYPISQSWLKRKAATILSRRRIMRELQENPDLIKNINSQNLGKIFSNWE